MSISEEDRLAIISYRKERALASLNEAQKVAEEAMWNLAGNRLYYAVYYAASAVLLKNKITPHTHEGTIRMLHLHFIKNGFLTDEDSYNIRQLYRLRITGDYEDIFDLTKKEIDLYLPIANDLVKRILKLL